MEKTETSLVTKVIYKGRECWKIRYNYFSCSRYTREEALAAEATLGLCYDCLDCENSRWLVDCENCINCKEASNLKDKDGGLK